MVEQFRELRRVTLIGRVEVAIRRHFVRGAPVTLFYNPDEFINRNFAVRMEQNGRGINLADLQVGTTN